MKEGMLPRCLKNLSMIDNTKKKEYGNDCYEIEIYSFNEGSDKSRKNRVGLKNVEL